MIPTVSGSAGRRSVVRESDVRESKALVDALAAHPRPAGGDAEAAARAHCAALLSASGYAVHEEPFAYSALPGRWATPVAGVLSAATLAMAGHLGFRLRDPRAAACALAIGGAALLAWAVWSARWAVLGAPVLRRRGVNLVATRGDSPRVWLVAHLDSKRQPVSILVRAVGITASALAWIGAVVVASAGVAGVDASAWWILVSIAGLLGAVPVALSVVLDGSPGALDNASGTAAVVRAALLAPTNAALGVLLTSAEELGLAGAEAWARARSLSGGSALRMINCDGVDDDGTTTVFFSGGRPRATIAALERASTATAVPVRVRRLLPGVLADSVALARAGHEAVTVSRGTYATLARIHMSTDRRERLDGRGIELVARLLAAATAASEDRDGH